MRYLSAVLLLSLCLSQPLLAHTKLKISTPADGAEVAALQEIRLEFSAAVRLTAVNLESKDGTAIAVGSIPAETATVFSVAVSETLAPGMYVITWRSVSGDSHIVSGEINFSVSN